MVIVCDQREREREMYDMRSDAIRSVKSARIHSDALGCHQQPSDAVRCNQMPSDAIRYHESTEEVEDAVVVGEQVIESTRRCHED
jgi:hypothetical protein